MSWITYFLIFLSLSTSFLFSQEKDSLIQLYPGMGDNLDFIDRELFGLYPDISGYQNSQLFVRDKRYLVSKVTYINNGLLKDTVLIEYISALSNMKYEMSQFKMENDKGFESPLDASVFTIARNNYDGKLEMFSKKYLFLNSDMDYLTGGSSPFNFKTPVSSVDSLMISVKPSVGKYLLYGTAGGFALGFFAAYLQFDDDMGAPKEVKWVVTGAIGAGIGFLLGWMIGAAIPPDILTIKFNSTADVTKLTDYAKYYFQYDRSLDEKYVELE